MAYLVCNNDNCTSINKKIDTNNITLVFMDGVLQPKHEILCETCGQLLVFMNDDILPGEITSTFGKFRSSNPTDKKAMIKKRNAMNVNKDDVRKAREKRENTIKNIKEKFLSTIKKKE